MEKYLTVVIGGGAAGICAAISKGRRGEPVVICEKTPQLGKKILASGNGRCNLLNDNLSEVYYNPAARDLVRSVFGKFGKSEILDFFKSLGLEVYSQEGRIFPITNQATSVLKVLEMELKRLSVPVEFNFNCSGLSFSKNGITVLSKDGKKIDCRKVIITGGGKTYPVFGSDGSMYEIAGQLGHTIIEPVPSAVPLTVKDSLCHFLQGQRIFAGAKSVIEGKEGDAVRGELLFTKYGLSGTCILDVSEAISIALSRHNKTDVFVAVDMVPFMDKEQLKNELAKRKKANLPAEEMLAGILPNKFCAALKELFEKNNLDAAVDALKNRHFKVTGTRGWNEAEFTSGGIDVNEVNPETLESKFKKGVYFAGEVLDVNGKRGGYNLGWAWTSGFVAGQTG
ncbi:MAG: NAD(P)/FAD-dependent oxidoreductase [Dehalococcoidales bacterium]|nr:NAD(P)/FAD-dependent oxidoreductase [Dehalococcoidales bacterium]